MSDDCKGFVWVGQPMETCERCGEDIADHDGISQVQPGDQADKTIPFDEARRQSRFFALHVTPVDNIDGKGPYRYEGGQKP